MNRISDRVLGKYEILKQLSTTGLASVYHARDTSNGKEIVLKVLHTYFTKTAKGIQQYLDQMARVQELRHPNIVPVYGVEQEGDLTAVVMEYVPWPTLKAQKNRKLPLGEVLTVLRQVAAALDYAHALGLVHRDLRPSNVFYDAESGQAKVSDFGTVVLVEGGHPLLRTTVNTPAPSYVAPEQIQGQPPDPRNDVYSLGALAYELLTEDVPFDALSPYTILSRQLTTSPASPSYLNEALPVGVDEVILKALRRRPEERYPSCGEMVKALSKAAGPQVVVKSVAPKVPLHLGTSTEADRQGIAGPDTLANGRVVCPHCGSGNAATALRCHTCWGTLAAQPVVTAEEEQQWVRRYIKRLRLKKRLLWSITGVLLTATLALWGYTVLDIRPALPPPSTAITANSAAGEWTTLQRDLLRTGVVPGPIFSPQGTVEHIFQTEGPILATPAVAGDKIFVATSDQGIVALDKATRQILWTYPVNGPVNSSPVVAGGMVFVGLRSGVLLALDTSTGEKTWAFQTHNPIYSSAAVMEGTLYLGSSDHWLYALDAATGELRWKLETGGWILATPTINRGIVVVGSQDGELYMVDASNGKLRYQVNLGSSTDNAITMADNIAYLTTRAGNVWAFDYTKKDVPWRKAKNYIQAQLYIWQMVSTPPSILGLLWSRQFRREQSVAEVSTADGRLFVATVTGRLRALDAKTGKDLWKVEGLARLYSSPIVSGDTVIQPASDGTVYGFDAATGEQRWKVSVQESITTPAVLANGTLYVPTTSGNLYAIR